MYDRILVPTDGSDGVGRAVDHALGLAATHDARVDAVYVVNGGGFTGLPMESSWEGIDEMLRADAEAAVEAVERRARECGCGVEVETHVLEGAPHREIVRFAESEGCDLVVMGTHGRGGLDRLLLGSVAEKVVRASRVPVMTVHVDGDDSGAATPVEALVDVEAESVTDAPDERAGESAV